MSAITVAPSSEIGRNENSGAGQIISVADYYRNVVATNGVRWCSPGCMKRLPCDAADTEVGLRLVLLSP
jgi:hypothetical protein